MSMRIIAHQPETYSGGRELEPGTTTFENIRRFEVEFGDRNILILERTDETIDEYTGIGLTVTGATAETSSTKN